MNPPVDLNGEPYRVHNEHFVIKREGVSFTCDIDGIGQLEGHGKVILTTVRLVLVNADEGELKAFDIPHGNTFKEQF